MQYGRPTLVQSSIRKYWQLLVRFRCYYKQENQLLVLNPTTMASKDFSVEAATASSVSELGSISSEKHHPAKLLMA